MKTLTLNTGTSVISLFGSFFFLSFWLTLFLSVLSWMKKNIALKPSLFFYISIHTQQLLQPIIYPWRTDRSPQIHSMCLLHWNPLIHIHLLVPSLISVWRPLSLYTFPTLSCNVRWDQNDWPRFSIGLFRKLKAWWMCWCLARQLIEAETRGRLNTSFNGNSGVCPCYVSFLC